MSYNIQYSHYHMSSVIIDINYIISQGKKFRAGAAVMPRRFRNVSRVAGAVQKMKMAASTISTTTPKASANS